MRRWHTTKENYSTKKKTQGASPKYVPPRCRKSDEIKLLEKEVIKTT
jgi:hypothetical protein